MFGLLYKRLTGRFNLKDKRLFFKFFFSFIVMSVIPILLLGILMYGKVLDILEDQVISSNIAFMNQGKNNLDAYFKQIHRMQAQLTENNLIRSFYPPAENDRVDVLFSMREIREELNKYGASTHDITDVLGIYFPNNEVVVTTTSYYEGNAFFNEFRKYRDISEEECFLRVLNSESRQYWKAATVYDHEVIPRRIITSVQSLPYYSKGHAYLLTLIDEEKVWQMFGGSNPDGWQNFQGIVDEQGELIASSEGEQVPSIINAFDITQFSERDGYFEMIDNHARYIVTYTLSAENNWRYFSIIPKVSITERISPVRYLYLGAILLALIFALFLSWFLSQKNYKPVRDIVDLIQSNVKEEKGQETSEYKMIHNAVSNMFKASKAMESKLDSHINTSRMHFLLQLLKGMSGMGDIKEAIDFYDLQLPHPYYIVAVMEMNSYNEPSQDIRRYNNFTRFAASNIAEKTLRRNFQAYQVEVDENRIVLLINAEAIKDEKGSSLIDTVMKEIIELLDVNLKLHTSIGIGCEYTSLDRISQSFQEAMTALEYISIRKNYQIMHFNEVHTYKNSIFYPIAKEQQLFNHVKLGDYAAAELILDEIYQVNFIEREIPVKLAYCLLNNLISSLLKIIDELKLDFNAYFSEDMSLIPELNSADSVSKVFEYIKSNLRLLCGHIIEKKNSHNTDLRDNILQYIESTYSDCNLSLMSVSDRFDVTTSYMSRFFKEQTGYNFNDYLNRFRIQNAKALLGEEKFTVSDIAEKVGYNSPGTFIRIFKKYESVTPGQYKQGNKKT